VIDARKRSLCQALSDLLSYPGADAAARARAAGDLAEGTAAAAPLSRFAAAAGRLPADELREIYTSTFDLQPPCAPYVGHQLLGDSPLRGPFLARLVEVYAASGYRAREELPDHLAEVLAFLAMAAPSEERDDLVRDGLLPALTRMLEGLRDRENPYRELLLAVQELFRLGRAATRDPAQPEVRP
jgi:nitrate reductase delta subunit